MFPREASTLGVQVRVGLPDQVNDVRAGRSVNSPGRWSSRLHSTTIEVRLEEDVLKALSWMCDKGVCLDISSVSPPGRSPSLMSVILLYWGNNTGVLE